MAKILVVDDSKDALDLYCTVLRKHGYSVAGYTSPEGALVFAKKVRPDLVITDIRMPGMDGFRFVKLLRSMPSLSMVPVVFLTQYNEVKNRIRGFELGADDFLPKPVYHKELSLRVKKVLATAALRRQQLVGSLKGTGGGSLRGDFSEFGCSTVLSMCELEGKTGVLHFSNQVGAIDLYLADGRVLSARVVRGSYSPPAEIVRRLVSWTSGHFWFEARDEMDVEDVINMSMTSLLLDAARFADENAQG